MDSSGDLSIATVDPVEVHFAESLSTKRATVFLNADVRVRERPEPRRGLPPLLVPLR
jgi:hypothetical protein